MLKTINHAVVPQYLPLCWNASSRLSRLILVQNARSNSPLFPLVSRKNRNVKYESNFPQDVSAACSFTRKLFSLEKPGIFLPEISTL